MSTCRIVGSTEGMGMGGSEDASGDRRAQRPRCSTLASVDSSGIGSDSLAPVCSAPRRPADLPVRFEHVHIESLAHATPERVITSAEIEARLAPLYERLKLNAGRLELMSGIRERRAFERGTRPSASAARAGALALEKSGIDRARRVRWYHALPGWR